MKTKLLAGILATSMVSASVAPMVFADTTEQDGYETRNSQYESVNSNGKGEMKRMEKMEMKDTGLYGIQPFLKTDLTAEQLTTLKSLLQAEQIKLNALITDAKTNGTATADLKTKLDTEKQTFMKTLATTYIDSAKLTEFDAFVAKIGTQNQGMGTDMRMKNDNMRESMGNGNMNMMNKTTQVRKDVLSEKNRIAVSAYLNKIPEATRAETINALIVKVDTALTALSTSTATNVEKKISLLKALKAFLQEKLNELDSDNVILDILK